MISGKILRAHCSPYYKPGKTQNEQYATNRRLQLYPHHY